MPVRRYVCAMVLMGAAAPAAAGERPGDAAAPDALSLLLQDKAATYRPGAPPTGLARLDAGPRLATLAEPLPIRLPASKH